MALTPEQLEAYVTAVLGSKRLRTAGGEKENHNPKDVIDALSALGEISALSSSASPIRMQKIRFGGSVVTGGCE